MGDFDPAFVHALAAQSWSLYGIGILLILLRIYARIHKLRFTGLQFDDYLMVLAGCLYTILIACLNIISSGGGSNLYPPEDFPTFTPKDIKDRINGSKIVIISEQAMLNVIYVIKACMLIMYTRLTLGLQIQRMVFYLSIYVLLGWIATEIAFFTACTPFSGYWAMPPPSSQCSTLEHYAIIQGCFNISSDTLMLFIPLPLITRLAMPWKQKAILLVIFSMGLFVILAAVLTKVFNLTNIWDPSYMLWYTRESSVAIYVSNLPLIWPLLRDWFPALRKLTPGNKTSSGGKSGYALGTNTGIGGRLRTTTIAGRHLSGGFGGRRLSESDARDKNGVVTTIRGRGDLGESSEELSSISGDRDTLDDPELGMGHTGPLAKTGYWGELRDEERVGDRRSEWEIPHGAIHLSTTVEISEEHVDEAGLIVPPRVLGGGKRGRSG